MSAVRLRADAERNRVALLAAARDVFAEQGLEASLDEIARRAGVGNATLYRRFPSRQDLIAAVFADRKTQQVELAERALREADPWAGFVGYVTGLCELQATSRGLAELLVAMDFSGDERLEQLRAATFRLAREVIERAKEAGALRPDFTLSDLRLLLVANNGILHRAAEPNAWRRQLELVLSGVAAR